MKVAVLCDSHIMERAPRCRKDNYLEAVLRKLDYVAKNNDKVIVAGDLFHIYSNSNYLFNKVYYLFSQYKNKFIIVPGNHDIFHDNYSTLDKTTLGSLYYTEAVDIQTSGFKLGSTEFEVSLVTKDMAKIPIDKNNNKVLIGHNYFDTDLAPKESLTREEISKLNYRLVFLGHDHKPYDEEFVGNSILIRMGSFSRIDVQEYNRDRVICYYQYDTETGDYERKLVPCKKTSEVYIDDAFQRISKKSKSFDFSDIGLILDRFKKQSDGNISLDKVLKRLKTSEKSIDYIRDAHRTGNVTYT